MTDQSAIERGVALVGEYKKRLRHREPHPEMEICVSQSEMKIIVAALTAAGEMVGERQVTCPTCHGEGYPAPDHGCCPTCGDGGKVPAAPASPDIEIVAKAICRENCAFIGEKPCFEVEGTWPNPNCQEPGCHAQARAAIAAIGRT